MLVFKMEDEWHLDIGPTDYFTPACDHSVAIPAYEPARHKSIQDTRICGEDFDVAEATISQPFCEDCRVVLISLAVLDQMRLL